MADQRIVLRYPSLLLCRSTEVENFSHKVGATHSVQDFEMPSQILFSQGVIPLFRGQFVSRTNSTQRVRNGKESERMSNA